MIDASVLLYYVNGRSKEMIMKDALYIPSYKFDILSVQAATRKGVRVNFEPDHADLVTSDGSVFSVERQGSLYFFKNVGNTLLNSAHTAEEWHKTLGHCNIKNVMKVEKVVEGMHISGDRDNIH